MLDLDTFKPIRNFGVFVFGIGVIAILCFLSFNNDTEFYTKIFIFLVSIFHIFVGFNIITRNEKFGFKSLKLYLYMMYPGFPLGYYFAKATIKYIEENNIKLYFKNSIKI